MFNFTKQWKIFAGLVAAVYLAEYAGVITNPMVPPAALWSFVILDILGRFKDKEADAQRYQEAEGDDLTDRQRDFKRKMAQMEDENEEVMEARIVTKNDDGEVSTIVIKSSGEIEVDGNPPADLLEAAYMLKDSIKHFGPEAIAQELQKQLAQIQERDEND